MRSMGSLATRSALLVVALLTLLQQPARAKDKHEVSRTPPRQSSGPVRAKASDVRAIADATARGKSQQQKAIGKLDKVLAAVAGGKSLVAHKAALAAIKDRIKVDPKADKALFLRTVRDARALINKNMKSMVPSRVQRDDAFCGANRPAFGWKVGSPGDLKVCTQWFNSSKGCRADVVTHEFFHFNGQVDVDDTRDHATFTREESMRDANAFAQLVSALANGCTDACVNPRCK